MFAKKTSGLMWFCIAFVVCELIVLLLLKQEILALNYGWDGRLNQAAFVGIILTQLIFLHLIFKIEDFADRQNRIKAFLVYLAVAALFLVHNLEVHYRWLQMKGGY